MWNTLVGQQNGIIVDITLWDNLHKTLVFPDKKRQYSVCRNIFEVKLFSCNLFLAVYYTNITLSLNMQSKNTEIIKRNEFFKNKIWKC